MPSPKPQSLGMSVFFFHLYNSDRRDPSAPLSECSTSPYAWEFSSFKQVTMTDLKFSFHCPTGVEGGTTARLSVSDSEPNGTLGCSGEGKAAQQRGRGLNKEPDAQNNGLVHMVGQAADRLCIQDSEISVVLAISSLFVGWALGREHTNIFLVYCYHQLLEGPCPRETRPPRRSGGEHPHLKCRTTLSAPNCGVTKYRTFVSLL